MIIIFTIIKSDPLNYMYPISEEGNYSNIFTSIRLCRLMPCSFIHQSHYSAKVFRLIHKAASSHRLLFCHLVNPVSYDNATGKGRKYFSQPAIPRHLLQHTKDGINSAPFQTRVKRSGLFKKFISNIYAYIEIIRLHIPNPRRYENIFTNRLSMG